MTEFYAQPYSVEHTGFYFSSIETFEAGMKKLNKKGCEEVEIQFIDGDDHLCDLAKVSNIHQGSVSQWFETLDDLDDTAVTQICFLLDCGSSLNDALDHYKDVCLFHGTVSDYACDLTNETSEVPEFLVNYIDYDAIAHDMELNGEIVEISHDLIVTNALDF